MRARAPAPAPAVCAPAVCNNIWHRHLLYEVYRQIVQSIPRSHQY